MGVAAEEASKVITNSTLKRTAAGLEYVTAFLFAEKQAGMCPKSSQSRKENTDLSYGAC